MSAKQTTEDNKTTKLNSEGGTIIWFNVFRFLVMHLIALYGAYIIFQVDASTLALNLLFFSLGHIGVTAGVHRLWSHRSYKASAPLRILLATLNCIALQNSIFDWSRDHRCHHKFTETDADPHNANRGFFFSHIGWLMTRKHRDVIEKGRKIDMSDLKEDKVVMFQHRHYHLCGTIMCLALPILIPVCFWNETYVNSFCITLLRYVLALNTTFLVNSAAHMWGYKPYDASINPSENMFVTFFAFGEGFHNYHHVFPQDYRTSEFGMKYNITTAFINFMEMCGLASHLTTVPTKVIRARQKRTGNLDHVAATLTT